MAAGDALELALGLLRAPARRELLAARPLPAGMTGLLAIAAGSHAALREAAERTGAGLEELQEASRFFVQQVLLVDGADAYRTLGAARDSPQARLHEHHRLLQRWLHPDRDTGNSWDSAFSARVNAAWSRVRNPRVRQAYDAELAESPARHAEVHAPAARGYAPAVQRYPVSPVADDAVPAGVLHNPEGSAGRSVPVAAVAAVVAAISCLGLAWYALQRDSAPQPSAAQIVLKPSTQEVPLVELAASLPATPVEAAKLSEAIEPAVLSAPTAMQMAVPVSPPADMRPSQTLQVMAVPDIVRVEPARLDIAAPGLPGTFDTPILAEPAVAPAVTARPPDPFVLFEEAEHAVIQLTDWLASRTDGSPPIWNDIHTEAAAVEARANLHARLDGRRGGPLSLESPHWQLGDDRAVLAGGYSVGGRRNAESGQFQVQLVRREQRWLVTSMRMEPAP